MRVKGSRQYLAQTAECGASPRANRRSELLPYSVLDPIVAAHIEEYVSTLDEFREWVMAKGDSFSSDPAELREWLQSENAESSYQRIIRLIGRMEYKRRQTCPGTKVSRVAFGIGRRLPIVEKWT